MARRGDGIYLRGRTWWLRRQREQRRVLVADAIKRVLAGMGASAKPVS